MAWVRVAVFNQKPCKLLNVKLVFRNDTPVGSTGHCGKHGCETCISSENLKYHDTFMRTGRGTQGIGHLYGTGDARAETNAVISSRNVIVHGLGNGHNLDALFV